MKIYKYILATCIYVACILLTQIRRAKRGIKALPHTCTRALQQPHIQYRMALLLATILAFLLGWPLFLSTLPRTPFAFIGHV